ncbi:S-layer family protein [Polaromonas sp.]|uniref:beta strand repeat-containing protein n=1 Tax=Polaromonas sp. TaxID=1869339 RepID=UPI0013B7D93D|nr:S-layer family protein [Polaromonas sp.]NDP61974.1 S-layer family protein [Polaromonas sp.]
MKNNQHHNCTGRKPALSSIGLAVIATLIASGAHAADTTYNFDGTPVATANGNITQNLPLNNSGAVSATIENGVASINANGTQTGSTASVVGNLVDANAIGNMAKPVDTSIDLSLINGSGNGSGGTGEATLLHSTNSGAIDSRVLNNNLSISLTGFQTGSAVNKDNTISAGSVANQGASSIAGTVPNGYTSTTPGSTGVSTAGGTTTSAAQGTVVVTTAQQTKGAAATATALDNAVTLTLTANTLAAAINSGAALTGNTVSASTKGNSSASTIDIQAGAAPSFTGSAVVSNTQIGVDAGATANNTSSNVIATVTGPAGAGGVTSLGGSLAVTGNNITSAATGNEALGSGLSSVGNRILLANDLAFTGTGATAPGATLNGYTNGTAVAADLLIANTQSNQGPIAGTTPVLSQTIDGVVRTNVDSLVNGAIDLSTNTITSSATGNAASSAMASGTGSASFSGSVALANQQDNNNVPVTATNTGSAIEVRVGAVTDIRPTAGNVQASSVSVAGNRSSASARGNEVGQNLSLNATTLALGNGTATLSSQPSLLQASGAATVSNRQVNTGAPVSASNTASSIGQFAGTVTGPSLSVNGNTQEAVALANNASNQLTLAGTTVGSGAGILSLQRVDGGDTPVPASFVNATLDGARAFLEAGNGNPLDSVTGSTLALTNNRQNAIGYGNLADNAMAVSGTTVAAPVTSGPASTVAVNFGISKALSGSVAAAQGVLNDQAVLSDVRARALSSGASAEVIVTGPLGNSSVLNNANTLASEAYGNFGTSGLTLNATNLTSTGFSSVANVTNLQAVNAGVTAQASTGAVALTTITGSVGSTAPDMVSSVTTSGNRIDAQANGSRAVNALNVQATNIATAAATPLGASLSGNLGSGNLSTNASFSLQNAQLGGGSVTATLRDPSNSALPSDVRIAISGDVTRSSVAADSNAARASATSNNVSNTLAIDALSSLASSSALQNGQLTNANVNALIGRAGVVGVPSTAYAFNATPVNTDFNDASSPGSTSSAGNGTTIPFTYIYSGWVRTADAAAANVAGWIQGTGANNGFYYRQLNSESTGTANPTTFAAFPYSGTYGGTLSTPNLGGVNLAVGGAITRSTLSVQNNTTYGVAQGNAATNVISVKGNAIAAGSSSTLATATDVFSGSQAVVADHALSNSQGVGVAGAQSIDSNVYGRFAIDAQPGAAITRSSLSVSGNSQMAEARANIASNSLALEGTGVTAVSALQSVQSSGAAVSALSNVSLSAPGAVTDSSLLLSKNSNIALAVINDATNSLTATGSQVGTGRVASINNGGTSAAVVTAEQLLANQQRSTTSVSSTATTSLSNQEALAVNTGGAIRSTLSIVDNTTAVEATANKAFNMAAITGTASQTASVALRNLQDSSSAVTASATTTARIALAPASGLDALNSGSALLDGNSTTALARGNTASNVLNSLAGSAYGSALGGSVVSGGAGMAVSANTGILNSQTNSGPVSASSTSASYQVALNSTGLATTGSSVGVTGNQVAAQAYGNSAVNQLTLNALNTGTPTAAVGSYQSNSGAVTATVSSVVFGAGITGGMTGSTARVNGNQITATAVGNSVVSSILAR